MTLKIKSIMIVSCAAMIAFSLPANATPKTECDSSLQQIKTHLETHSLDRGAVAKIRRSLTNAEKFQEEKKYKKCVEITNNLKKGFGIK